MPYQRAFPKPLFIGIIALLFLMAIVTAYRAFKPRRS